MTLSDQLAKMIEEADRFLREDDPPTWKESDQAYRRIIALAKWAQRVSTAGNRWAAAPYREFENVVKVKDELVLALSAPLELEE